MHLGLPNFFHLPDIVLEFCPEEPKTVVLVWSMSVGNKQRLTAAWLSVPLAQLVFDEPLIRSPFIAHVDNKPSPCL